MDPRDLDRALWRLDSLDEWRRQVDDRLHDIERQVGEIVKAEEFASRLAVELGKRRSQMFSRGEKVIGLSFAGCTLTIALASLIWQVAG